MKKTNILSVQDEQKLLSPIDEHVGRIQEKINALRVDGTDRVTALTNHIAIVKENASYTKDEKAVKIAKDKEELAKAKAVEAKNSAEIKSLINEAVQYLDAHYDAEYYSKVVASCAAQREAEDSRYADEQAALRKQYESELAKLSDQREIKDRRHDAYAHRYHLIDLLRLSKFTPAEKWWVPAWCCAR